MHTENRRDLLFGSLVAAIAFLVYANSLGNGFTLDDNSVLLHNPALKGNILSLFSSIDTINETQLLPLYRPVTYLTFWIEGRTHGFDPFLIRLFNVLLHSANTFLVYRLARTLFKDNLYAPLIAALLFAVHPLQSEGVDFNVGGRNTMLACFFSLAAYLVHCHGITRERMYWAFTGAFLYMAGIFSKENAIMILPFIFARELQTFRHDLPGCRLKSFLRLSPYFAAGVFYIIMRWLTLSKLGIQTSIIPGVGIKNLESMYIIENLGTRLLNNLYMIPRYLLTAVWPTAPSPRYAVPDDLNLLALPLFGAWLLIFCCIWWLLFRARSQASLFGLSWAVLFWVPVSGIFYIPIPMADRYLYLPAIGLWLVISDQACRLILNDRSRMRRYGSVVLLTIAVLAALTIRRNLDWKNNLTLYSRFVEQYPDSIHAHAGLGSAYYFAKGAERNLTLAVREFEWVLSVDPFSPNIHTYLGNISLDGGDLNGALHHYDRAIEIFPYDKEARINRGVTLEKLGRSKEALTDYLFFLTTPGSSDNIAGARQHAETRVRELSK